MPSFSKILHIFPLERRRVPLFDKKNTQGRKTTNLCKHFLDEYGILKKHTSQKCTVPLIDKPINLPFENTNDVRFDPISQRENRNK